jgi:muconolactone delta-isomerase
MRFLAIIERRTKQFSEEQFSPFLDAEAERVRELYTQGIMRAVSSRGDVKGAVAELECADLQEAQSVLATLPFAQQGLVDIQIIPLLPYRGFAPRNS